MFAGCTNLKIGPDLPALILSSGCYAYMFSGCTSLTAAPNIQANIGAEYCFQYMFVNCSNLLSAKIDVINNNFKYCMYHMFDNCSKLSSIEVNFTSWPTASESMYRWVYGVAANGIFIKPQSLPIARSGNNIPSNWTVLNRINGNLYYAEATGGHAVGDPYSP